MPAAVRCRRLRMRRTGNLQPLLRLDTSSRISVLAQAGITILRRVWTLHEPRHVSLVRLAQVGLQPGLKFYSVHGLRDPTASGSHALAVGGVNGSAFIAGVPAAGWMPALDRTR